MPRYPWESSDNDGVCYSFPGEGGPGSYFYEDGCWRKWSRDAAEIVDDYDELDGGDA